MVDGENVGFLDGLGGAVALRLDQGQSREAVAEQGGNYVNYLMPAILVTTGIGAALESGVGLITDMKNGVIARFRALPIHPSSVLVARSLSDLVRTAAQLTIVVVVAALLFDFSDSEWHFGLAGAVEMANAYPEADLLLHHWGSVDAPDFSPFNGNPEDLFQVVLNPSRIRILAPGAPHTLSSSAS